MAYALPAWFCQLPEVRLILHYVRRLRLFRPPALPRLLRRSRWKSCAPRCAKLLHGGLMMNNWTADFPILAADENGNRLVYLDSAATTQHPKQVLDAVVNYYNKDNANPHRGVYELAMRATDAHEGARHTVAEFFNAEDDEIVFTQNTTEALNLVAYSYGMHFLHEGDEIVISVAEHHSNLVPWQRVAEATGAKLVYMYPGKDGRLTLDELEPRSKEVEA